MDNVLRGNFGGPRPVKPPPFDLKFGESQNAIPCVNCRQPGNVGVFIIWAGQAVLLCLHCVGQAIMKYQETHLMSQAVQVDAEVPPEKVSKAIEAVISENPGIPEETVAKIARSVINKL